MADPKANTKQGYHQFSPYIYGGERGEPYGSFEVFWADGYSDEASDKGATEPGWYWWACFPGCLPDGEATGPFATSQAAYDNAQEGA